MTAATTTALRFPAMETRIARAIQEVDYFRRSPSRIGGPSAHKEWQHFLETLFAKEVAASRIRDLDDALGLSKSGNSEILFAWLRLAIKHRYDPAVPALERFLTTQGRRKFLRPLYADLMKTDWGRPIAKRIYQKARASYHPVSAQTIDTVVR